MKTARLLSVISQEARLQTALEAQTEQQKSSQGFWDSQDAR
jgi:hypothetical protein